MVPLSITQIVNHFVNHPGNQNDKVKLVKKWCTPTLLEKLKCEFENENNVIRSWGTLPYLKHFEGRGAC
jgi:hypothetical protein